MCQLLYLYNDFCKNDECVMCHILTLCQMCICDQEINEFKLVLLCQKCK